MSGLIETFKLRTDDTKALEYAIGIFMIWNKTISHYKTGTDVNGKKFVSFQWHESGNGTPFMSALKDSKLVCYQVTEWLRGLDEKDFGARDGGDGSDSRGFEVHDGGPKMPGSEFSSYDPYTIFTVKPTWIYYSK